MTGLVLLDVAIGVVFSLMVFSFLASAIREIVANLLDARADNLWKGLDALIEAEGAEPEEVRKNLPAEALRKPGRVSMPGAQEKADWVSRETFVRTLAATAHGAQKAAGLADDIKAAVAKLDILSDQARGEFDAAFAQAEGRALTYKAQLDARFDAVMENVAAAYKRRVKYWLFLIGVLLAALTNYNILLYAQDLFTDEAKREAVVRTATLFAESPELGQAYADELLKKVKKSEDRADALLAGVKKISGTLSASGSSIGWAGCQAETWWGCVWERFSGAWLSSIASWITIGFGCVIGAQFWFDLLKSLVRVRDSVRPGTPAPTKSGS